MIPRCGIARSRKSIRARAESTAIAGRLIACRPRAVPKCLVLDLDNTLWGGVIGDDGLHGIVLGQGSALGEAFRGLSAVRLGSEPARRHPRGLFQERRGECARAVRTASGDGSAPQRYRVFRGELGRQGQPTCADRRRHSISASMRWSSSTTTRSSAIWCGRSCPGRSSGNAGRSRVLYAGAWPMRAISKGWASLPKIVSAASSIRANAERELLRESATDMASYLRVLDMELIVNPFDNIEPEPGDATHQQDQPVQSHHAPVHGSRGGGDDGGSCVRDLATAAAGPVRG